MEILSSKIDSTLESLAGAKIFTTPDLALGFWQVEMEWADKQKMTFSTSSGHFGLTNAPQTFQYLMEFMLSGLSGVQCLVYLDGILVFSTFQEHLQLFASIFDQLYTTGLKLRGQKYHFTKKQITYR